MAITQVSNSLVKQDLTISGGTVDNTVIGSGTPAAGTFTTIAGTLASAVAATTQAASDNSTKVATTAYVTTALANLVDSAPGTLNTLNELAAALGDDANFATTVTNSIATKLPLAGGTLTGATTINGGNPALVISNSGDAKVNFVRSSNNISYSMTTSASGGHGFYDNAASAYDLYMKNGLVGIGGVTNPARELEVTGSGNVYIRVTASTANDSAAIELKNTGETWTIANDDTNSDTLEFRTSGGTPLVVDTSGNVGIGTSSPTGLLHVVGSGSTVPIKIDNTGTGGTTWRIWSTNNSASDGGGKLGFYNEDTASRIMTLENTGNVGIGTNDPSHRLEINTSTSGQSDVLLLTNENTATNNTAGILFAPSNGITGARIEALATEDFSTNANRTADLLFYTRKDGTLAESMRIDGSGSVVINKSSFSSLPTPSKLNIFGDGVTLRLDGSSATTKSILFRNVNAGNPGEVYADGSLRFRTEDASTRITFHTNSSGSNNERMRIDASGFVGIGTTTLNKIFNIADPAQGGETLKLHFEANSSGDKWGIYSYDRTNAHYADLYLGQQAIYIKGSNSRVGIGTTNPANPLVVKDGTKVDMEFLSETNGTGIQSYNRTSSNYGYIRFLTNTETMRLDTSGNLMIGDDTASGSVQGGTFNITKTSASPVITLMSRSATATHQGVLFFQQTSSTSGNYTATGSGRALGQIGFRGVDSAGVAREGVGILAGQDGAAISGSVKGYLMFRTADTERMRIQGYSQYDSVIIWNNAPVNQTGTNFRVMAYDQDSKFTLGNGANNSIFLTMTNSAGNTTFTVQAHNGQVYHAGTISSDRDLKENIENVPDGALARIKALKPRTYNFKEETNRVTDKKTGFIAQEVKEAMPEGNIVDGTDGNKDMGVDYNGIIAQLVKAVQELEAEVAALKGE